MSFYVLLERIVVGMMVSLAFFQLFRVFVLRWALKLFLGAYLEKRALQWLREGKISRALKLKNWVEKQGYLFHCCRP